MIPLIKQLIFATEEELRLKVIITVVGLIIHFILLWFSGFPLIFMGLAYMWGWHVMKRWFGVTAFASIFSGSLLISIFIIMAFLIIGAFIGALYGFIALVRYAYLMILKLSGR